MRRALWAVGIALFISVLGQNAFAQGGGYLGAQLAPLTPEVIAKLGVTIGNGTVIVSVVPNSPAAKAGLRANQVIPVIDGRPVYGPADVVNAVQSHAPGQQVQMMVIDTSRGFNSRNISVTLGAAPAGGVAANSSPPGGARSPLLPNDSGYARGPNGAITALPGQPRTANGAYRQLTALQPLRNQFCHALAPAGWGINDQDDRGAAFGVASPDRSMSGSYGIMAITSAQLSGFYGPQFRTPATVAQYLASSVAGTQVQATGTQPFNGMQVMTFAGGGRFGYVIYRLYPLPADPAGYVISARIAVGSSEQDVGTAGAAAASIDCTTTFKAPPGGYAQVHAKASDTGTSKKCKGGDCDDSDLAGTYNSQLGTGWVHSESTGQNYLVDTASDYHSTGPNGPGYYRQTPNGLEKLSPGMD